MLKEENFETGQVGYYVGQLHFFTYLDDGKKWRWRAKATNGRIVASSGESFASKRNAVRALEAFIKALNIDN